jgi:hypothetical protein
MISTTARKGTRVRYDAAERKLSAAVYADFHITRGETYTVKRMKPWVHGCFVILEGFENQSFDIMIFVPDKFRPNPQPENNTDELSPEV